jgi:hypothetical protein
VECAIKACIARKTNRYEFPDLRTVTASYSHDLERLIGVAGLSTQLESDAQIDPPFAVNWRTVKDWSEQSRYEVRTVIDAANLVSAIGDPRHGVLRWLRQHW